MPWASQKTSAGTEDGEVREKTGPGGPPPTEPVGYLVNRRGGLTGTQGIGYDYVLGEDGLYVQSENPSLTARVMVAPARVRGLAAMGRKLELRNGRIPAAMLERGVQWFRENPDQERLFLLAWDERGYRMVFPEQSGLGTSMIYTPMEGAGAVAEFHSHGRLGAFFSRTDNQDEQGFRIYGVAGRLHSAEPEIKMRVGVYGHFAPVAPEEVFLGVTA